MNKKAMRIIRDRSDAHFRKAIALSPRGGDIPVGGAHFDEHLKGSALADVLSAAGRERSAEQCRTFAKSEARFAIRLWNSRTNDFAIHRSEMCVYALIDGAVSSIFWNETNASIPPGG